MQEYQETLFPLEGDSQTAEPERPPALETQVENDDETGYFADGQHH